MPIPLEVLVPAVRIACARLREGLHTLLGDQLVALWAYGAATQADHPKRMGDVDTHCLLASQPSPSTAQEIRALQEAIARDAKIEWDSWYILESDAHHASPPRHVLGDVTLVDGAWALHRAHWLAGQYVLLHGTPPTAVVPSPVWTELEAGLRNELEHIERFISDGQDASEYCAYAVWNACRIIYSIENRDVVISKRRAALWALERMPGSWHSAIHAAGRVYEDQVTGEDVSALRLGMPVIVAEARRRLA